MATSVAGSVDMGGGAAAFHRAVAGVEAIITRDVGRRGIAAITLSGQLAAAAAAFLDAHAVVVLTGFPCRMSDTPPTETDGPPGAVALASAALRLGKPAAIATDTTSAGVLHRVAAAAGLPTMGDFALYSFPARASWTAADDGILAGVATRYDHAVAIERAGRAADGSYYTMRGLCMDHLVAPIDELITAGCASGRDATASAAAVPLTPAVVQVGYTARPHRAKPVVDDTDGDAAGGSSDGTDRSWPGSPDRGSVGSPTSPRPVAAPRALDVVVGGMKRTSTGIGDGGNECGMGVVARAVAAHIPHGDLIACVVPADHLITAGVSNWGGWGLVAAVEALARARLMDAAAPAAAGATASTFATPSSRVEAAATLPDADPLPPALAAFLQTSPPGSLLPSEEEERGVAKALIASQARDGITGAMDGSVDGMPLDVHLAVLAKIRDVLRHEFGPAIGVVTAAGAGGDTT